MSDITANIVLQPVNLDITMDNSIVEVVTEPINLNLSLGGFTGAGGNNQEIQYNYGGILNGIPNVTYNGSNLSLGNISNIKILGGVANYAIITDGNGNLSFGNVLNANFANFAGNITVNAQPNITSLGTLANLNVNGPANLGNISNLKILGGSNSYVISTDGTGNLSWAPSANSNFANFAGNITLANQPNITNVGTLTSLNVSGNVNFTGTNVTLGNSNVVHINGGLNGYYLQTDGTGNLTWAAGTANANGTVGGANTQVQFNDAGSFNGAANFTFNKTSNVLTVPGNVVGVFSGPVINFNYGIENAEIISNQTGTYNFDLLGNSIRYTNANATANITINFRGNSSVTANTLLGNGQSITATYVLQTGTNNYSVSNINIDSTSQTIKWINGVNPTTTANSKNAYTFTIIKTSTTPTYDVLGSLGRFS